ncbi:MAG: hypothetical protein SGJ05_02310 [bacterium]|nr:hypothetical protein [bacterium]
MARNNLAGIRSHAILALSTILVIALFTGCPTKHGGDNHKVNIDSAQKVNKSLFETIAKLPPMTPVSISMDSLKMKLNVHPSVTNAMLSEWFTTYTPTVLPDGPGDCSMVVVEFTDREVSQLFNRVAGEYRAQVSTLVNQMAAPLYNQANSMLSPNVYSYSCDPASAPWVQYSLTPAQIMRWSVTSPMIKNQFMSALQAFRMAAGTAGTQNILLITNLGHGSLISTGYTGVQYFVANYNAATRLQVIQLMD